MGLKRAKAKAPAFTGAFALDRGIMFESIYRNLIESGLFLGEADRTLTHVLKLNSSFVYVLIIQGKYV